ncbi:hypothetical protein CRYUN_Cryun14cG0013000 [Craigia yunnanensis]
MDIAMEVMLRLLGSYLISCPKKNLLSWNAMIGGYCQKKQPHEALKLFHEMQSSTLFEPDKVTIVSILPAIADLGALDLGVLSACNHGGLVEEGKRWFKAMTEFGLTPKIEHYGCMADLLGRAGCVEEAEKLIEGMPYEASGIILTSLLFAYWCSNNVTRAETVLNMLVHMKPSNHGSYVMLRNLLISRVLEFVSGDRVHAKWEMMQSVLRQLWMHMRGQQLDKTAA